MKRYIVSSKPILAQTGNYIKVVGKRKRTPVKTWKTVLKERGKRRIVKVQERAKPLPIDMIEWLRDITR